MSDAPMYRARDLRMTVRADEEFVGPAQSNRDANCARGLPSVAKDGTRDARVAIVGYGPSLADTWPGIVQRRYDAIWTVSRAHDFLIERGVVPTHHTDTDFRERKARYNSQFRPTVRYVMATHVHPAYLDVLAGHDVRLFHIVIPGGGLYPGKYLKMPVMFDAGLQAARLAYELGYRNQDWYGMDASMRGGAAHAGPHGGDKPEPLTVEIAGRPYPMSTMLVRQALFCEEMLRQTPKMRVTIHGDGALRPFLLDRGKCRNF